jgi:hypothetical protein
MISRHCEKSWNGLRESISKQSAFGKLNTDCFAALAMTETLTSLREILSGIVGWHFEAIRLIEHYSRLLHPAEAGFAMTKI